MGECVVVRCVNHEWRFDELRINRGFEEEWRGYSIRLIVYLYSRFFEFHSAMV